MSWRFKDPVAIMKEIMPWLFKDPIVAVAWLNFDTSSQVFNKWPKKIKLTQLRFFSQKTTNKIFMYLLVLVIVQNNKNKKIQKNWEQIQSSEDTIPFLAQVTKLPWIRFLSEKPLI